MVGKLCKSVKRERRGVVPFSFSAAEPDRSLRIIAHKRFAFVQQQSKVVLSRSVAYEHGIYRTLLKRARESGRGAGRRKTIFQAQGRLDVISAARMVKSGLFRGGNGNSRDAIAIINKFGIVSPVAFLAAESRPLKALAAIAGRFPTGGTSRSTSFARGQRLRRSAFQCGL